MRSKKRRIKDKPPKVGATLPIYRDFKNGLGFEDFAVLLKKEDQQTLTFFADYEEVPEDWHPSIYIAERWLVEFTTWQKTTFRTHRWIRRLVRPASKVRKGGDSVMSLYTTYDHKIEDIPDNDDW